MLNILKIKQDFPLLNRQINGKRIVYLDSTATSLKPQSVVDKINDYYTKYSANVFRGIYSLSEQATAEYEEARAKVAGFIGGRANEIVFTRNATESINLIAYSWGRINLRPGDEVVVTIAEHHSNFVIWQQLAEQIGITFKVWKVNAVGELDVSELDNLITRRTKLLGVTAASNVVGTINDIKKITKLVKRINKNCLVLVDAAQAVPHMPVDVGRWGADFAVFSGHKMLGPTGIGVLWGKPEILDAMPPFNFGGEMIREVHVSGTVFNDSPHKFEAGTPHIAGAIGLGAAVDYLNNLGMTGIRKHEEEITEYALGSLKEVDGLTIYGSTDAADRGGVIAFHMNGIHPHDIAQVLDEDNICIRVGFHCAQPLHEYLGIGPTARASFYVYTSKEDIDALVTGLKKAKKVFK